MLAVVGDAAEQRVEEDDAKRAPRILPAADDEVVWRFTRKRADPPGIAWFGFRSLWGHLRHFVASAIATDGIDARDWMLPESPETLLRRVADRLDAPRPDAPSLTEAMERDVWIDYLADTGEHEGVTRAVARLVVGEYTVEDDEGEIVAPRGDLLVFGGDTAYPVATTQEIHDRVVVPFNRVLLSTEGAVDGKRRVLLGIPGNHDWYDGLDGFSRLFRRKRWGEDGLEPSAERLDESAIESAVKFVGHFVVGATAHKLDALVLHGYRAVQDASFWALPLTPHVRVHAVDRQLKELDGQQRKYFRADNDANAAQSRIVLLPDPILAFGKESRTGAASRDAIDLDTSKEGALVISGDIHHYRRERVGETLHVTAGGGGAFLHPAPMYRSGINEAEREWPSAEQSLSILRQVPFYIAAGRAGLILHAAMAAVFLPTLVIGGAWAGHAGLAPASVVAGILAAVAYTLIGGLRERLLAKVTLAALAGVATAFVPTLTVLLMNVLQHELGFEPSAWVGGTVSLLMALGFGGFTFGAYLAALTRFGFEETQAFTALAHPGFKHFVRLRVRADGKAIDAWVIGLVDPLGRGAPVLVDRWTWVPPSAGGDGKQPLS